MTHNFHPSYRPDIDGLRAIAILSVVIFHAFPAVISGGFIGVDVFFVISGFLISSIIFKSLETGSFGYVDFYIRRVKRIFPALILVLVVCLLIGWYVLLPGEFSSLGKHVVSGAFFVSNITSWKEVGYFNPASELKPLLHLWSLGVEEQYYIIWPVLVAFIWKRSHNFLWIVVPILICSFLINVYAVSLRQEATFFLPVTRFWELMMGGFLAFAALHRIRIFHPRISDNAVSAVGFCLLVIGFFWIDSDKKFPGWWALLPTTGAFLLIYAGKDSWVNSRILANKAFVFIGLISYPLYLWHWPLLVYTKILGLSGVYEKTVVVAVSLVLAFITYAFIEKPIRFSLKKGSVWLISVMLIVTAVGLAAYMGRLQPYHDGQDIQKISRATGEWDYPGSMQPFKFNGRTFYRIRNGSPVQKKSGTVVFFGDSNVEQYYPNIEVLSHQDEKDIVFSTQGGCPPIPNVYHAKLPQCDRFADDVIAYASNPEVKSVVIAAQWYGYFEKDSPYFFKGSQSESGVFLNDSEGLKLSFKSFEAMLMKLASMGKTTYVLLNIPRSEAMDPKNMVNRSVHSESPFFSINQEGVKTKFFERYRNIDASLIEIVHKTNAVIIDPKLFLCKDGKCPSVDESGNPIYKDAGHLRPTFVRTQIHFLDKTLN